jgi:hypothetical protein
VVPINNHDFLDRELLLTRKLLNQGFPVDKLKSSLRKFFGRQDNLVNHCDTSVTNDHRYVLLVVITIRSCPRSWLFTGFITKATRRVPLMEQELLTLSEHMSSSPVFSGVYFYLNVFICLVRLKNDVRLCFHL